MCISSSKVPQTYGRDLHENIGLDFLIFKFKPWHTICTKGTTIIPGPVYQETSREDKEEPRNDII